jgi:hypothetical protein
MLFPDQAEISQAINAGLRVLEQVANINSLLQQCHQYFNKLQALAEARLQSNTQREQKEPGDVQDISLDQELGIDAINTRIFGEWDSFSGIADVFNDSLLPEFDAEFFNGL